ncbi:hypothetical protein Glove_541g14 [Diversispora epigaea]|uniref:Uncharacterized protein n=1 Tax=Diversispora epigaea TaxID=1348612 RepID=A0A397GG66_9GLOM|nr:hypothetical protein Glove_541g14 [Diversispora epigaea]
MDGQSIGPTSRRMITTLTSYLESKGINGLIGEEIPDFLESTNKFSAIYSEEKFSKIGESCEFRSMKDLPKWMGIGKEEFNEMVDKYQGWQMTWSFAYFEMTLKCLSNDLVIRHADLDIAIKLVPINWNNFEWSIENAIVVVSMLYNDFDKQETLLNACIGQKVALFISWDSGMELEHYVTDKRCPRTRLHKRLIDYQVMKNNNHESMDWILFQIGIFDEEILKNDISTITTAFNSPKDLAMLVAETITSKKVLPNRNYVIGDFVAHTFLQHANNGM